MHEVLVNCLFKLAQEKMWLGELTIAVDLGRKATKETKTKSKTIPKAQGISPTGYIATDACFN